MRSATVNDIYEVEKSITWARNLQKTIDYYQGLGEMSAIEASIPKRLNPIHWLPATLQCLASCRFSELQEIELIDIKYALTQRIHQKKTNTVREIRQLILIDNQELHHLDNDAKIMHTTYDSYANDFKKSLPQFILDEFQDSKSLTHIFRHLRATWMHSQGKSIEEIAEYFQHQNKEATKSYIHDKIKLV